MANPLTGAPGAAVLYAFLAVLLWPRSRPSFRGARVAWAVLWGTMAVLMLTAPAASASLTASGGTRASVLTIAFAAAFALAAVGVLIPATTRPANQSARTPKRVVATVAVSGVPIVTPSLYSL